MSRIDTICVCVYVCDCTVSMWPDQLRPRQTSETIYIMIHVCTTTIKILDSLNGVGFFFSGRGGGGGVSFLTSCCVHGVFFNVPVLSASLARATQTKQNSSVGKEREQALFLAGSELGRRMDVNNSGIPPNRHTVLVHQTRPSWTLHCGEPGAERSRHNQVGGSVRPDSAVVTGGWERSDQIDHWLSENGRHLY